MKRLLSVILVLVLGLSVVLTGCSSKKGTDKDSGKEKVKVGMVTDSGTIDDKSFNQGTWEGIARYAAEKGTIKEKYLKPNGEATSDYVTAIDSLVDAGYGMIITPGYKFSEAIAEAGKKYPDVKFLLLDAEPAGGAVENVASVYFKEHESGFLAGVAAATATKTGKVGFVGGMEIPPVQKFDWGFQAGVKYANDNLGTKAEVAEVVYQGTFNEPAGGKTLAGVMYNKGMDIIFTAAGGTGLGVINEAKERAEKGEEVFVIGVDTDQYAQGEISTGKSVILTSAIKRVDVAAYNYIDKYVSDSFAGGGVEVLAINDNGTGLPEENPNFDDALKTNTDKARKALEAGEVVAPGSAEELAEFLK